MSARRPRLGTLAGQRRPMWRLRSVGPGRIAHNRTTVLRRAGCSEPNNASLLAVELYRQYTKPILTITRRGRIHLRHTDSSGSSSVPAIQHTVALCPACSQPDANYPGSELRPRQWGQHKKFLSIECSANGPSSILIALVTSPGSVDTTSSPTPKTAVVSSNGSTSPLPPCGPSPMWRRH